MSYHSVPEFRLSISWLEAIEPEKISGSGGVFFFLKHRLHGSRKVLCFSRSSISIEQSRSRVMVCKFPTSDDLS